MNGTEAIVAGPEITEAAGQPAAARQIERQRARYRWVETYCRDRDVAEIACGTGQGLGLLANSARSLVGADYSRDNLAVAQRTYGGSIPLVELDAQHLPFAAASLDVVVLLETLYFLPSAAAFIEEARRCLRPGGKLLISVINRDTADYNPRRIYHAHYGTRELALLLRSHGFSPRMFGSVRLEFSKRERVLRPLKRAAVRLGLIPSVPASAWLKRLVFGRLEPLPYDLRNDSTPAAPPVPITDDRPDRVHQALLCVAERT